MMKRSFQVLAAAAAVLCASSSPAQPTVPAWGAPDEVGPNHRAWRARPVDGTNAQPAAGVVPAVPPAASIGTRPGPVTGGVVELSTGMNYWDGQQWTPSDPTFDLTDDAFVAERVQHKVRLNAELNVAGSVSVTTRDGVVLSSTPVAIALFDPASGRFLAIAGVTNSTGVLVASNQVVYPKAFSGGVCADIVLTLEKATLEQDIVITGRVDPADWGFPTNSRIQVLTEFYRAPVPGRIRRPLYIEKREAVRAQKVSPDLMDEVLGFGEFVLGSGRAYIPPSAAHTNGTQTVVGKEFVTIEGRTFLIETVDSASFRAGLKALPPCGAGGGSASLSPGRAREGYAFVPRARESGLARQKPQRSTNPQLSRLERGGRGGAVIDYIATIGSGLYDRKAFSGDTTYHVTGTVSYNGPVIIEGGAVIKYNTGASITFNNSVTCATASYRPAVFTCVDDNSTGESLAGRPGYTGFINPAGYAAPALRFPNGSPALSHLRVCNAQSAIQFEGGAIYPALSHSQLVQCMRGVVLVEYDPTAGSGGGCTDIGLDVKNVLFSYVNSALSFDLGPGSGIAYGPASVACYSCTFDHVSLLSELPPLGQPCTVSFQNCVLANVSSLGDASLLGTNNGFYACSGFGSAQFSSADGRSPFQPPVGAGAYYLTDTSQFRDRGSTAGLPAGFLADLKKGTTFPPLLLSNVTTSVDTVLVPQAQRDADALDLGFHYDPIDYITCVYAVTNATLTITNGAVIAYYDATGIWLQDGAQFSCQGTATALNRLIDYRTVQEQPVKLGSYNGASSGWPVNPNRLSNGRLPATFRFTEFLRLPGSPFANNLYCNDSAWLFSTVEISHCRFLGGYNYIYGDSAQSVGLTNNLFEYMMSEIYGSLQCDAFNNLARYCLIDFQPYTASPWYVRDNAFDSATLSEMGDYPVAAGYNAFINATNQLFNTYPTDIVLTNFAYASGPLGEYYQASTNLVNRGSRTADLAGLYHYTVQTNLVNGLQIKETNSVVDIGLHYVACDSTGKPIDTDGDGIPDAEEDRDGDAQVDVGETDWNSYNSANGLASSNRLQVFTPLK